MLHWVISIYFLTDRYINGKHFFSVSLSRTSINTLYYRHTSAGEGSVYRARQRGSQRKASYTRLLVVTGPRDTATAHSAEGHSPMDILKQQPFRCLDLVLER